jgi:hypothetical protein
MLARSDAIPRGRGWLFEPKLDGFRCLVSTNRPGERGWVKTKNPATPRFAEERDGVGRRSAVPSSRR